MNRPTNNMQLNIPNMMQEVVPAYAYGVTDDAARAVESSDQFSSIKTQHTAAASQLLQEIPDLCFNLAYDEMVGPKGRCGHLSPKSIRLLTIPKAVRRFLMDKYDIVLARIDAMAHDAAADGLNLKGVLLDVFQHFQNVLEKYLHEEEASYIAALSQEETPLRDMLLQGLV